jgi:hypothetical protein
MTIAVVRTGSMLTALLGEGIEPLAVLGGDTLGLGARASAGRFWIGAMGLSLLEREARFNRAPALVGVEEVPNDFVSHWPRREGR